MKGLRHAADKLCPRIPVELPSSVCRGTLAPAVKTVIDDTPNPLLMPHELRETAGKHNLAFSGEATTAEAEQPPGSAAESRINMKVRCSRVCPSCQSFTCSRLRLVLLFARAGFMRTPVTSHQQGVLAGSAVEALHARRRH